MNNDWNEEDNFNLALSQRTEEIYRVPNYEAGEDGLIEASVMPLHNIVVFPRMVARIFIRQAENHRWWRFRMPSQKIKP